MNVHAPVFDVRSCEQYSQGGVVGSYSVGLDVTCGGAGRVAKGGQLWRPAEVPAVKD